MLTLNTASKRVNSIIYKTTCNTVELLTRWFFQSELSETFMIRNTINVRHPRKYVSKAITLEMNHVTAYIVEIKFYFFQVSE